MSRRTPINQRDIDAQLVSLLERAKQATAPRPTKANLADRVWREVAELIANMRNVPEFARAGRR